MTHQELNKFIKDKFGSIANFCKRKEMDVDKTRMFLNRKPKKGISESEQKRIDDLLKVAEETDNFGDAGKKITEFDRFLIYEAITLDSGTASEFCRKHPQFDYRMVNDILSNNGRVTNKTQKVVELIKFLNIKS